MTMERIDYDRLVADYEAGLVDKLRGFGPAAEYLELWVPDEDPIASLCNMIDAAGATGTDAVSVFIGPKTAARLDAEALSKAAGDLCEVRIEAEAGGLLFDVSNILEKTKRAKTRKKPVWKPRRARQLEAAIAKAVAAIPASWEKGIGPAHAQAVDRAGRDIAREGRLRKEDGLLLVEAAADGVTLSLLVDPAEHVIRRAAHQGASSAVDRALLDQFCRLVETLPIQEASDHGVIRLEHRLRDKNQARPVAGIVIPEAVGQAFLPPQRLIRAALALYRNSSGYSGSKNEFDSRPSAEWLALSGQQRRQRLDAAIAEIAAEAGFPPEEVEVTAIEHDLRVVVRFLGSLVAADKQGHMLIMETGIKEKVDGRLELYQEELKDSNIIRRLSGRGKTP